MVSKVWNTGEPKCLRDLLPAEDARQTGATRANTRGEIELHAANRIGQKAFRCWGPEAYNRTCQKVKTRPKPQQAKALPKSNTKRGGAPGDMDETERKGYYAYLESKYQNMKEKKDEEGRKMIWTDGSAIEDEKGHMRAGAGVFIGVGHKGNREIAVDGPQTNQRAELTAVLYCLEAEEGPIHIRTDSKYVQLGAEIWRHQWRSKAWYKKPQMAIEIDHADLWQR
eukprot:gene57006-biopygen95667